MKKLYESFLVSLKAQMAPDALSYKKFITENTYLGGNKFSFVNHEYQKYILDVIESNPGCYFYVSKCSQIGLSELFNRVVLARMAVRPRSGVIVSFPSKIFSQEVFKTRISSIINESPVLSSIIDNNIDSASVKMFYNGSIAYALGGSVAAKHALLNRPIDTILVDERDRQDNDIITGYHSRMTHTPAEERLVMYISTPTVDGIGIDADIKACGVLHTPWVRCLHCGHEFIADFYEHVKVPGYNDSLQLLTKEKAAALNLSRTFLECPNCKKAITKTTRETVWKVTYNKQGSAKDIGITIDPFAAMGFISMEDLVVSSLRYSSVAEFVNQALGKVCDSKESIIQVSNIIFCKEAEPPGQQIFGLDMGKECWWARGVLKYDTTIQVTEIQLVKLSELEDFLANQHSSHVFTAGVMDQQPYQDLMYKLVRKYPRLFSAIYVSPMPPRPNLFDIKMSDKNDDLIRQVTINKSLVMDSFAGALKDFFTFNSGPYDATLVKHLTDMRRVRDFRFEELIYKWVKSAKGVDHLFHTMIYLYMAGKLALSGLNTTFSLPFVINKINVEAARVKKSGIIRR